MVGCCHRLRPHANDYANRLIEKVKLFEGTKLVAYAASGLHTTTPQRIHALVPASSSSLVLAASEQGATQQRPDRLERRLKEMESRHALRLEQLGEQLQEELDAIDADSLSSAATPAGKRKWMGIGGQLGRVLRSDGGRPRRHLRGNRLPHGGG